MRQIVRFCAVLGLLTLTVGLCIHYGTAYEENWPHPTGDQLADNPGGWDGEQVLLFGTVETVRNGEFSMTVETDAGEVARVIEVSDTTADVDSGATVQVYGVVSDEGTNQRAQEIVVVNASSGAEAYKLGISIVGILIAAGAFFRYWRINPLQGKLTARGERDG